MEQLEAELSQRLRATKAAIDQACAIAQRPPSTVRLLAVSKRQSEEKIRILYHLGQKEFGENYAQELVAKASSLRDLAIQWHYIGHLQSNKIKKIVEVASAIQSVGSLRHASQIAKAAEELGKVPFPIFIEVNAEGEPDKSGLPMAEAQDLAQAIQASYKSLDLRGIMAIPPASYQDDTGNPGHVPTLYSKLRALADTVGAGELSLGMTGDLRMAVAAGSSMVRIGTGLFGLRPES